MNHKNEFFIEIDKNDPENVRIDSRMLNKLAYIERKKRREKYKILKKETMSKRLVDNRKRKRKMKRKKILYKNFRNGATKNTPVPNNNHYNYLNIIKNKSSKNKINNFNHSSYNKINKNNNNNNKNNNNESNKNKQS